MFWPSFAACLYIGMAERETIDKNQIFGEAMRLSTLVFSPPALSLAACFRPAARRAALAESEMGVPPLLGVIDTEKVLALVDSGVDPLWRNKEGKTLLMIAAEKMQPDVVQRLIEKGAPLDAAIPPDYDRAGMTALHVALFRGNKFSTAHLLAAGAPLTLTDAQGCPPIYYAATDVEKLELMIAAGADVNAPNAMGKTPLMHAAVHALDIAPVKKLLEAGADVTAIDNLGKSVVDYAGINENARFIQDYLRECRDAALQERQVASEAALQKTAEDIAVKAVEAQREIKVFRAPVKFRRSEF